jgi:hypothetical protein
MITTTWRGTVRASDADGYLEYHEETGGRGLPERIHAWPRHREGRDFVHWSESTKGIEP